MGRRIVAIGIVLFVVLGIIIFKALQPTPIWEENAKKLKETTKMQADGAIVTLNEVTPFGWDEVYAFRP